MHRYLVLKILKYFLFYFALLLVVSKNVFASDITSWKPANSPSARIDSLLTTPYSLFAGEYNPIFQFPKPFNGVYISKDHGQSWNQSGLKDKGVTGLAYDGTAIYASAYFSGITPSGVWKSFDMGKSWTHSGLTFSGLSISATVEFILFGTTSNGLYRSENYGSSWTQVIGNGFSPGIKSVSADGNTALAASTDNTVFISKDNGNTWNKIQEFNGKQISSVLVFGKTLFIGTGNFQGLHLSQNEGATWEKVAFFENKAIGILSFFDEVLYVGSFSQTHNTYGIFKSSDLGKTWFDVSQGLNDLNSNIKAIAGFYSSTPKLLISQIAKGLSLKEVSKKPVDLPFLDLPWKYQSFKKDALKIYSYFDHSYPFLGYGSFLEPNSENTSTYNFFGIKEKEPFLWYSSHNGIDFTLPYDTEIVAPAEGFATYSYTEGGGNTIKINHGNGFQSWFMHLQKKGLAVSAPNTPIFVNKLDRVGYVGLSGNTTGPHLHFSVLKDKNANLKFDDFPDGLVDPYGWQSIRQDPWKVFSWLDLTGSHTGSESSYLWTQNLDEKKEVFPNFAYTLTLDEVSLTFPENFIDSSATITLKKIPFGRGGAALADNQELIAGSTFEFRITDLLQKNVQNLDKETEIRVGYSSLNIDNVKEETLKLVRIEDDGTLTQLVFTLNLNQKILSALTNETGIVAIMGEKIDYYPPQTTIHFDGERGNNPDEFINKVLVNFSAKDNGLQLENSTYVSLDGKDFEKYLEPLVITNEGETQIFYKSIDKYGNGEEGKSSKVFVTKRGTYYQVKIEQAKFQTR
ncbi:MAG: peptidoglycan DD-metalloendopeptidase family protein [Patescibacteria group bacterium]